MQRKHTLTTIDELDEDRQMVVNALRSHAEWKEIKSLVKLYLQRQGYVEMLTEYFLGVVEHAELGDSLESILARHQPSLAAAAPRGILPKVEARLAELAETLVPHYSSQLNTSMTEG